MCPSPAAGSTFLQRLYRVFCTVRSTGFTEHRARLLRLVEPQGAFHAATRNRAGQSLLHTLCMAATYSVTHRAKNRRRWMYPDLPKYREWSSSSSRAKAFTDQLCALLQRHGADFHSPDSSGERKHVPRQWAYLHLPHQLA